MRGPHNIWRLIRTAGDVGTHRRDRRGAGGVSGPAAPAVCRACAGLAVQMAGAEGRPGAAAGHAGADGAWPGLYQVRPDPFDPPRCGGRRVGAAVEISARQAAAVSDRRCQSDDRGRACSCPSIRCSRHFPNRSRRRPSRRCIARGWPTPGEDVAVKVLRPGIERAFRKDIDAFYFAARMIELLSPASRASAPDGCDHAFRRRGAGRAGPAAGKRPLRRNLPPIPKMTQGFRCRKPIWHLSGRR